MGRGITLKRMGPSTMGTGERINSMGMAVSSGLINQCMRVIICMGGSLDRASSSGQMEPHIKAISPIAISMDEVSLRGAMGEHLKAPSKIID